MTRTEAIKNLNALNAICGQKDFYDNEFATALNMAINSLKVDEMYQLEKEDADEFIPKRTGHWIKMFDKWGDIVTTVSGYECSKCCEWNADKDNFCPNCGADMRTSEDK